jgi:hypothetical protein
VKKLQRSCGDRVLKPFSFGILRLDFRKTLYIRDS